jgi:outer membrane protein OmpA-like peptidoglycan-associated protein
MKGAFPYFLIFAFSSSIVYAQSDTTKQGKNKKPKAAYKQGPSYIDAHLYKAPRIQQDTIADSTVLKKKLKLKTVDKNSFGPVSADCEPNPDLALQDSAGVFFEKPHSAAWFTFTASIDTDLTFDIAPTDVNDDIDFLLFKDESGNFASDLKAHKARPVRSNIARCDKSLEGKTGLSSKGKHSYEALGKHNPYSTPLKVKKGERFFLAVDNYTHANGPFSLFLHLRWPTFAKPTSPVKPPQAEPVTNVKLHIIVLDSAGKPASTRLKLAGVLKRGVIDTNHVSKYSLTLQRKQRIKITAITQGYLLSQGYFNVPDTGNVFYDTVRLKPIKQHQNMVLDDIQFVSDEDVFMPSAMEPLSNLLEFMKSNPTVHILIKGYVNDPQQINSTRYDQDLSERRAKAVLNHLTKYGIDASRLE